MFTVNSCVDKYLGHGHEYVFCSIYAVDRIAVIKEHGGVSGILLKDSGQLGEPTNVQLVIKIIASPKHKI